MTLRPCDYFRKGWSTILNSERAAIKVARQLFESCSGEWVDPDFGPNTQDPKGARSIYVPGGQEIEPRNMPIAE